MLGIAFAVLGLVFVVGLVSGVEVSSAGVLWASARWWAARCTSCSRPTTAAAVLGLLSTVGLLPMSVAPANYNGVEVAWWIPLLPLGLVTATLAYSLGIAAIRRLGSRLSSYVGLTEVLGRTRLGMATGRAAVGPCSCWVPS